jgi:hypothetical protein
LCPACDDESVTTPASLPDAWFAKLNKKRPPLEQETWITAQQDMNAPISRAAGVRRRHRARGNDVAERA